MFKILMALLLSVCALEASDNQTDDLSPILFPESLPFTITIVQADFQLPSDAYNSTGLQTYVFGTHKGKWLLLAGRTNGLHGFNIINNFPPEAQNTTVYVVNPEKKTVKTKSLNDPSSHLSQAEIDTLSVTAAQYLQVGDTLYVIGGYGIDTLSGQFTTKSTLTAIDIPGLIRWVESDSSKETAAKHIRQTSHPLLQVTGGSLLQDNPHAPFLLALGQNFPMAYLSSSNGIYTEQIRPFKIIDNGHKLYIQPEMQPPTNPNYRRRDLNIVPIIKKSSKSYESSFLALSGVFTEAGGIWTVPIEIRPDGSSSMNDPSNPPTFKQAMNNYISSHVELFSKKTNDMYIVLLGGLTYMYYDSGSFVTDSEIPFTNQVTTIKIDSKGNYQQFLMENEYPALYSQLVNPGNLLYFGASSRFFPADNLPTFANGVFSFDSLGSSPVLLGYIVGGIQSTVMNTNTIADSSSSPYIFSVFIQRR